MAGGRQRSEPRSPLHSPGSRAEPWGPCPSHIATACRRQRPGAGLPAKLGPCGSKATLRRGQMRGPGVVSPAPRHVEVARNLRQKKGKSAVPGRPRHSWGARPPPEQPGSSMAGAGPKSLRQPQKANTGPKKPVTAPKSRRWPQKAITSPKSCPRPQKAARAPARSREAAVERPRGALGAFSPPEPAGEPRGQLPPKGRLCPGSVRPPPGVLFFPPSLIATVPGGCRRPWCGVPALARR